MPKIYKESSDYTPQNVVYIVDRAKNIYRMDFSYNDKNNVLKIPVFEVADSGLMFLTEENARAMSQVLNKEFGYMGTRPKVTKTSMDVKLPRDSKIIDVLINEYPRLKPVTIK